MAWREQLWSQASKLMEDPRVAKLAQDERVLKVAMQVFQLRGKVQAEVDRRVAVVAKSLNLATRSELRDLKRKVRRLEQDLGSARRALEAERQAPAAPRSPASPAPRPSSGDGSAQR